MGMNNPMVYVHMYMYIPSSHSAVVSPLTLSCLLKRTRKTWFHVAGNPSSLRRDIDETGTGTVGEPCTAIFLYK